MSADGLRVWGSTSPGPVNSNTSPSPLLSEAIVPAGFHHTLCAVSGQARIVMGFRPGRL